ncbi:MAG TPA: hypothetical protein VIO62_15235 [Candidatus Dormibacteraeota bacterium]|jgi:hypothetical protein
MMNGLPNGTVRAASQADTLVNDMRGALVQATEQLPAREDANDIERAVSYRITTVLMVLLLGLVFVTSAAPDLGPSLAGVLQSHL